MRPERHARASSCREFPVHFLTMSFRIGRRAGRVDAPSREKAEVNGDGRRDM